MTSDGITKSDWSKIHKLAVKVVNASMLENQAQANLYTKELLRVLDLLEKKYGILPTILATRADYVIGDRNRLRLFYAAFAKAFEIDDKKNQLSIASSLAEHFAERNRMMSAHKWLSIGQKLLKINADEYESKNLTTIAKNITANK